MNFESMLIVTKIKVWMIKPLEGELDIHSGYLPPGSETNQLRQIEELLEHTNNSGCRP